MRTAPLLVSVLLAVPFAFAQDTGQERLSYDDLRKPISWQGSPPSANWAWDGVHVALFEGKKLCWFDPASGKLVDAAPEPTPAPAAGKPAAWTARIRGGNLFVEPEATGGERGGRRGRGRGRGQGRGGEVPDGAIQLTTDGEAGGARMEAHASRDGAFASFVRGNNLFAVAAASKELWQITDDGGPERFHGYLDWVYQEEVYGRGDFQGHWWSPEGGMCVFLSLDESPVKDFTLVNEVPDGFLDRERSVTTEVMNYPKAGDPNPVATLSVAHAGSKKIVPFDLSAFPKDVLVVRVEWTADGKTLLVTLQDRIQTWAELCAADPHTGKLVRWIREESSSWVNRPESPRWLPDGSFLWLSERTGFQHVYRYQPGGTLVAAVTSGDWQVRGIERVDAEHGVLWFDGTKDGAAGRHVYRIGLDGKGLCLVTPGAGTHGAELSQDGHFLIDNWSATDRPTTVRVLDGATGAVVREVGQADKGQASKYAFAEKKYVQIPARDGCLLDATVQLPVGAAPGHRHPVYLPTYSGPDAPSVHDAWSHNTWHQFMAQQGFLTLQVNVRTASNRGQQEISKCYQRLGEQELKDLEDAVDWVCRECEGDSERVAIEGWSYGGFMAAFALTHSKKFALGLAGAGVYDWRLYDTIYTERYMRTPQENKAGYDATSVIKAAKDLHGHLVLLHGTMDDNVHLQNTMQLVWELEKAGKQNFEMMLYPRSQHGLAAEVGPHSRAYQWRRLQSLLEPAKAEASR